MAVQGFLPAGLTTGQTAGISFTQRLIMANLHSRCRHYIFVLFLLSFFFSSPNLSGRRLDVYYTSTVYTWCGPSANLECRSEIWCTRLAGNAGRKKIANSPSGHHRTTSSGYIFTTKRRIDNQKKKLVKQQCLPTCSHNMVNFSLLAAEICW